jgi:hypothetical protein
LARAAWHALRQAAMSAAPCPAVCSVSTSASSKDMLFWRSAWKDKGTR